MSNSVHVEIPANCQVLIQATANASLVQQVVVTCDNDRAQFTGSGEGVPMTLPDASDSFQLSAESYDRYCNLLFTYKDEWSEWKPSRAEKPVVDKAGPFTTIQVAADDTSISSDTDKNDTIITILCFSLTEAVSQLKKNHDHRKVHVSRSDRSTSSETPSDHPHQASQLTLHAKVGTNCPTFAGMVEISVIIDAGSGGSGPEDKKMTAECRAMGWKPANVAVWDMRNHAWPLYNWVSVALTFNAPDGVPELKGAYLVMTCWLNYWFSVPTGYKTTDWSAQLYNSKYKVTRVIP